MKSRSQLSMCWMAWRLAHEGPSQLPSQTGSQHPLSHSLAPQDMLSLLFLGLLSTQSVGCAPRHLRTGHALQGGIWAGSTKCRQMTLWEVNFPPTPLTWVLEFIRVQRSQSLGGHLWKGDYLPDLGIISNFYMPVLIFLHLIFSLQKLMFLVVKSSAF